MAVIGSPRVAAPLIINNHYRMLLDINSEPDKVLGTFTHTLFYLIKCDRISPPNIIYEVNLI